MKSLLTFLICALLAGMTFGQSTFVGDWTGKIEVPGGKLGVLFHIAQESGKWLCKMDVPMQGAKDIVADNIEVSDKEIRMTYASLNGKYVGRMNKDRIIVGTWSQNGMDMALDLEVAKDEVLNRPQHPKPPYDYVIEEKTIEVETGRQTHLLAGTLTYPRGEGPFPTVILVSGSGPQDRDETILGHKPFWVIADFFAKNGIATFRYDDRGIGKSTGDFSSATTMDFKTDALAALQQISVLENINADRIGIVGHSEGGLVSALAAAENSAVKFIIMLAGPGVAGKDVLRRQTADISRAEGATEEEMKRDGGLNAELIELAAKDISREQALTQARKRLQTYYKNQLNDEERAKLGDFEVYFNTTSNALFTPWMKYFLNLSPQKYIERINCPVFALIGEKDLQVSPEINIPALKASLEAAPTSDWEVREVPDVNHLFQKTRSGAPSKYGQNVETFNQLVMAMMRDWIKAR